MSHQNHNDAPYSVENTGSSDMESAILSVIKSSLSRLGTPMLVRVESVHGGGATLFGKVDVIPLVNQQDRLGRQYQRAPVHNVPYCRIQGGASALIIDPVVGDIGFIIIAGRDMSHAITNRAPSPPASFRQFSMQDCVYVGGFLNNGPNQYIQATESGWRIVTPGTVEIQASGITANCNFVTTGDVRAGSISLKSHTHGGVKGGGGSTGGPQ